VAMQGRLLPPQHIRKPNFVADGASAGECRGRIDQSRGDPALPLAESGDVWTVRASILRPSALERCVMAVTGLQGTDSEILAAPWR
jgi:hypothetical protein